jgi:hypothetical protein
MFDFRKWLRWVAQRSAGGASRAFRRRSHLRPMFPSFKPSIEVLESRVVPATITWNVVSGGSWGTAANWDLNRTPTTGDDVVIPDKGTAGPSITITYSSGTTSVNSITSAENLSVSSGTLNVVGNGLGTDVSSFAGALAVGNGANNAPAATLNFNTGAGVSIGSLTVSESNQVTSATLGGGDTLIVSGLTTIGVGGVSTSPTTLTGSGRTGRPVGRGQHRQRCRGHLEPIQWSHDFRRGERHVHQSGDVQLFQRHEYRRPNVQQQRHCERVVR